MGMLAQQAGTDGMEGAGPAEPRPRAGRAQGGGNDALGATFHLGCGATRESEQQDAAGIVAVDDQMCDPVRQRVGLARAGASDDQQRAGDIGTAARDSMLNRAALLDIEDLEVGGVGHLWRVRTETSADSLIMIRSELPRWTKAMLSVALN